MHISIAHNWHPSAIKMLKLTFYTITFHKNILLTIID